MRLFGRYYIVVYAILIMVNAGCAENSRQVDRRDRVDSPRKSERVMSQFTREEIRTAQEHLKTLGYYNGEVDGLIGPQTRRAVSEFQKDSNLPVTGQLNRQTINELRSMLGAE